MRIRWFVCGLLWSVAACPAARAGLYVLDKPSPWPLPENPRAYLLQFRETKNRAAAEAGRKKLEKRRKGGELSVDDSIDLGGYHLRLGEYDQAIAVLTPALARDPKNFMVLANLASAYYGIKEYRRATELQRQVLTNWPRRRPGWTPDQLWWYRRVEKYQLTLLESRNREKLLAQPDNTLDNLFSINPFADDKSKYLIGAIDLRTRDRLPPDVLAIVEQLLLWMPHDNRLYWLFGELLNARGEVAEAVKVFDELPDQARQFNGDATFWKHRKALREAVASDPRFQPQSETASAAVPRELSGPPPQEDMAQKSWLPDWRQLGVGFGSGLVVGMLLLLQFRQLTRRSARTRPTPAAK